MIRSIFTIAYNSNEAYDLGDHLSLSMTSYSSKLEHQETWAREEISIFAITLHSSGTFPWRWVERNQE